MPGLKPNPRRSELEALLNSKEPAAVLDAILSSVPSLSIIADLPDAKILRVSDYGARSYRRPRRDLEGHFWTEADVRMPTYDASGRPLPVNERPLSKALQGETVGGFEQWVETVDGERIPIVTNAAPIRNSRGELIGAISSSTDLRPYKALEQRLREALAQREAAVAQREALYRELTHRVKNHLQIITALVSLEARVPALSTKELAEQMKGKLQALAAVYRSMDRVDVGARVEARTFVADICGTYASDRVSVESVVAPSDLTLSSEQAGPIGMLLSEAVCNSRKHAFSGHSGHIHVSLRRKEPGRLRLEVADDGVGWGAVDPSQPSHGLDLLRMFAKQLHCELEFGVHRLGGALVAAEIPEAVE